MVLPACYVKRLRLWCYDGSIGYRESLSSDSESIPWSASCFWSDNLSCGETGFAAPLTIGEDGRVVYAGGLGPYRIIPVELGRAIRKHLPKVGKGSK